MKTFRELKPGDTVYRITGDTVYRNGKFTRNIENMYMAYKIEECTVESINKITKVKDEPHNPYNYFEDEEYTESTVERYGIVFSTGIKIIVDLTNSDIYATHFAEHYVNKEEAEQYLHDYYTKLYNLTVQDIEWLEKKKNDIYNKYLYGAKITNNSI